MTQPDDETPDEPRGVMGPDREVETEIPDPQIIPFSEHERRKLGWYCLYCRPDSSEPEEEQLPPLPPEEVQAFLHRLLVRKGLRPDP